MTYEIYNDLWMWPTYLQLITGLLTLLAASMLLHELGHLSYFWIKVKRKVYMRWHGTSIWNFGLTIGTPSDYLGLSDKDYVYSTWSGIIAGAIPIIILSVISSQWIIVMLIPYIAGCWYDLKNVWGSINLTED